MAALLSRAAGVLCVTGALPTAPAWSAVMADPLEQTLRTSMSLALQQSDSDGSNSSADLSSELDNFSLRDKPRGIKCRWVGCGLWFSHLDALSVHVTRVHAMVGDRGLFYCGWEGCSRGDRGFNARYKMLVHVRTHTNEKPHHCYKCDKSFSRAENLKIHARSHTGERPYVCPIPGCGKAYSNSSDRFKHTRTHSVDKPYCCKVPGCPKRYTDPSSLRKHVKTYRHFCPDRSFGASPEREAPSMEGGTYGMEKIVHAAEWESDAVVAKGGNCLVSPSTESVLPEVPASCDSCYSTAEDARYGLLRSWLQTDVAPHSMPLPWGLSVWTGPWLRAPVLPTERLSISSDEEVVQVQDRPLDLTVRRASTVT